jgi:hypothetical protein
MTRVRPLPDDVRARMIGRSFKAGCPVSLDDLALLSIEHLDFDGAPRMGALVVAASVAEDVLRAFDAIRAAGYRIERMQLVDDFEGDDDRSMAANNSSGFNGRFVAGTTRWSMHAYGLAVDVNPLQNPWVHDGVVDPPAGAPYVDRTATHFAVLRDGDPVVRAFEAIGWEWGGRWEAPDWHHFNARR